MALQRFGCGFLSALIFPLIKMVQNGTVVKLQFNYLVGLALPLVLLGILIGFYAVIVENKEDNMGRLFRICIALPALVTNLASGTIPTTIPEITPPAQAQTHFQLPITTVEVIEVKCERKLGFAKGFHEAMEAIVGNDKKYWWVKKLRPENSHKYVMIGKDPWWILGMAKDKPSYRPYFDSDLCEMIKED